MAMYRRAIGALLVVATAALSSGLLAAPSSPDASHVRLAAESYDEGVRAWSAGRFAAAASHFEAADEAVPSAVSLAEAIKARRRAGHEARAATLAALALRRHPSHRSLRDLANDVLRQFGRSLHRLEVRCTTDCVLAAGQRAIVGAPARVATIYVEPGTVTISGSFLGDGGSAQREITATAGGSDVLELRPPDRSSSAASAGLDKASPRGSASLPADDLSQSSAPSASRPLARPNPEVDETWRGLPPAVFFVGAGVTTVLTSVAIWSGVDTLSDPGQETVRAECVGLGTECQAYQDGLAKEDRTNALIGVTVATAAVTTVLGLLLTDWGTDEGESTALPVGAHKVRWCANPRSNRLRFAF